MREAPPQTKKRDLADSGDPEEEEHAEHLDDEPDNWKSQLRVELDKAKCSTGDVLDLMANRREDNTLTLEATVHDPSAENADPGAGAALAGDVEKLRSLVRKESPSSAFEGWSHLLRWWRIADRAYAFHGLMEHLRELKKKKSAKITAKGGRPKKAEDLEDAWNALVGDIHDRISFKQASHYDRIGAFLLKFPGFVWQTHFVTLDQWKCTYNDRSGARAKNFVTVVKELIMMSVEEKNFWGSLERIRQYHASSRPSGRLPDGTILRFIVEEVPRDGDCGFTVIRIPRDQAANALLKNLHRSETCAMIGMEIQSMLQDGVDDPLGPPAVVLDDKIRRLLKKKVDLHLRVDDCVRNAKSTDKFKADLEAVETKIVQWCCSKETCLRFVNSYIRDAHNDGYLQTAVQEIGTAFTSFDALARIYRFRAAVWQRKRQSEEDRFLRFVGWVNEEEQGGETIHMMHDGRVHFDRLRQKM